MATATLLTSGMVGWETANRTSFTTASVTPGANCILVLLVATVPDTNGGATSHAGAVTVSGSGPTGWTSRYPLGVASGVFKSGSGGHTVEIGGTDPGSFTVTWTRGGSDPVGSHAYALWKVTGYDTGTPVVGGASQRNEATGQGTATLTMSATPASGDITLALCFSDNDPATAGGATFAASGNGTWTEDADGSSLTGVKAGFNAGQRTGWSSDATVKWDDVNTATDDFNQTQIAIAIKDGGAGPQTVTAQVAILSLTGVTLDIPPDVIPSRPLGYRTPVAKRPALQAWWVRIFVERVPGQGGLTPTANVAGFPINPDTDSKHRRIVRVLSRGRVPEFWEQSRHRDADLGLLTGGGPQTVTAQVATLTLTARTAAFVKYPTSVSSRKWLDQNGNVYLLKCFSSWGMAQNLTNAEITTALQDASGRGFNAVNVALFGNNYGAGWTRYQNIGGQAAFTGSPYASSLGAAWGTVDHIVSECSRLGMVAVLSLYTGFGTYGNEADVISAGTTNMYNFGVDVATRYASYPNIVWHLGADDNWTWATGDPSTQVEAFFDGIKDTEGGANGTRLVIAEANQGSSTYSQWPSAHTGTGGFSRFRLDANGVYDYGASSTTQFDAIYTESGATSYAVWDSEPPYKGADHYSATEAVEMQNQRERVWATFIRGAVGINFGHEDWWPFGATGLYSDGIAWTAVKDSLVVVEASYAWTLIDKYVKDTTWAPSADGGFLNTGVGSGDTKAAVGLSDTAALVYFPNTRASIEVDTTLIAGTGNVRLRWYDPTNGTYTNIATSEAQNATRSITYPTTNSNSSGADDWVLVVDLTGDQTVTAQVATLTLTGIAGTLTGGPTSRTAQVATLTLTGIAGAPTVGNVTVTAQVATLTLTGIAGTPIGGPVTLTAQIATVTLTGVAGSPSLDGSPQSVTAQIATLGLTGVAGSPTGGAVSLAAQVATLALTGVAGSPSTVGGGQSVTAQIATLTLSGIAGTPTPGPISVTAQVATLTLTGVAGAPSAGGLIVTAQVATITLTGRQGTLTGGPVTLTAQVASLLLLGVAGYAYAGVLILPAERTYTIRRDARTITVEADARRYVIPNENRTTT